MNSQENQEFTNWVEQDATISHLDSNQVIQIAGFLSQKERNTLFESICTNQDTFQFKGISNSKVKQTLRLSLDNEKLDNPKLLSIQEACIPLSKRILGLFPRLFEMLQLEPIPVTKIPLSFIIGFDGHNGIPHSDECGGQFKISILYYLNKTPKAFQGGALEFYKTDNTDPSLHHKNPSFKIEHEDNLLVVFPSQMYHGVTEVSMDSNNFEDGRFVLVAFIGTY